jgi:hypothetical protein
MATEVDGKPTLPPPPVGGVADLVPMGRGAVDETRQDADALDEHGLKLSAKWAVDELARAAELPHASHYAMAKVTIDLAANGDSTQYERAIAEYVRRVGHER